MDSKAHRSVIQPSQLHNPISLQTKKKKLANRLRPECVTSWLQKQRSVRFTPKIPSIATLADSWWAWWQANQPEWRAQSSDGTLLQTSGGDTSSIRVGGQAGILEFIMVLAWWGALIPHPDPSEMADTSRWREAVIDVAWVLSN